MIDFKGLETFVWVTTLGSFRGAALKLHTTQPAISQRIAQLEGDLGTRLLHRDRRAVTPTPRGRALLVYAEKLLGLRSEMLSNVGDVSAVRGILRLGVAETIVHTWLTRFIKRVNGTYPHLALEIEVDVSRNLSDRLLVQEIDLAFLLGPPASPSVQSRSLCSYPVAFVASPAIKLSRRAVPLQELAAFPIVTFARNTRHYVAVRALFNRPDLPAVRLHASTSLATVVRMAIEGLWIAVIPPVIVTSELASGALRLIATPARVPDLAFVASWLATPDTQTAERVAQIAVETAAGQGRRTVRRGAL
jgi:DNA-binding transcriptional LysR family regulator